MRIRRAASLGRFTDELDILKIGWVADDSSWLPARPKDAAVVRRQGVLPSGHGDAGRDGTDTPIREQALNPVAVRALGAGLVAGLFVRRGLRSHIPGPRNAVADKSQRHGTAVGDNRRPVLVDVDSWKGPRDAALEPDIFAAHRVRLGERHGVGQAVGDVRNGVLRGVGDTPRPDRSEQLVIGRIATTGPLAAVVGGWCFCELVLILVYI
jgi:hypothetical protein